MVPLIWDPGRPILVKVGVSGAHTPVLGFEQDPWLSRTEKEHDNMYRPRALLACLLDERKTWRAALPSIAFLHSDVMQSDSSDVFNGPAWRTGVVRTEMEAWKGSAFSREASSHRTLILVKKCRGRPSPWYDLWKCELLFLPSVVGVHDIAESIWERGAISPR